MVPASLMEPSQPLLNCRSQTEASNIFKIIPINISGPSGSLKTYVLFDDWSSIYLLDKDIANQLSLKGRQSTLTLQWYGDNVGSQTSYKAHRRLTAKSKACLKR